MVECHISLYIRTACITFPNHACRFGIMGVPYSGPSDILIYAMNLASGTFWPVFASRASKVIVPAKHIYAHGAGHTHTIVGERRVFCQSGVWDVDYQEDSEWLLAKCKDCWIWDVDNDGSTRANSDSKKSTRTSNTTSEAAILWTMIRRGWCSSTWIGVIRLMDVCMDIARVPGAYDRATKTLTQCIPPMPPHRVHSHKIPLKAHHLHYMIKS